MPETWPRLSESLAGPKEPGICQSCGSPAVALWQEHDSEDEPESIVIALCVRCEKAIIDPHPRLYRRLEHNRLWPGAMAICTGCANRKGLACTHPDSRMNGGTGLRIDIAEPGVAFFDGTRGGRRAGWTARIWPEPARGCSGHIARGKGTPDV